MEEIRGQRRFGFALMQEAVERDDEGNMGGPAMWPRAAHGR